jgi:hypothetical protein
MGNGGCHEIGISDFVYFCTYQSYWWIRTSRTMFLFKGEGIVTPCFPKLVNITGLAKNYGELINVNM